ncbi:MAG: ATP-binding cassette domain-containing protein [Gammaproteobacteria bacterium]|nr:ATP-binding cassette domain-containing protein [Gammaproteobacteria bacterium]
MGQALHHPNIGPYDENLLPLVIESAWYDVGGQNLINGLDLRIESPDITVIMGSNGAGKSILLRLIHGLLELTSGAIKWGGKATDNRLRQQQSLVFQKPVLLRRTVSQNLDFVLKLPQNRRLKRGPNSSTSAQLLKMVGLHDKANQPARSLSGGEQQRLALARALATRPKVLLLDEATASLDPASISIIENIVLEQKALGVKVIFVTHDLAQAKRLADEVVFMSRGRVLEHSKATEFFLHPKTEVANAYLSGTLSVEETHQ